MTKKELEIQVKELETALENSTKNVESLKEELEGTKELLVKSSKKLDEIKKAPAVKATVPVNEAPGFEAKYNEQLVKKRLATQETKRLKSVIIKLIASVQKAID